MRSKRVALAAVAVAGIIMVIRNVLPDRRSQEVRPPAILPPELRDADSPESEELARLAGK